MMNFFYPCEIDDCDDAAETIAHLPLCVIQFRDGETGFALTGGGQDLSWEICEAYIAVGCCPPFHFCSDLPRLAGHKPKAEVLAGVRRTIEVSRIWADSAERRLLEFFEPCAVCGEKGTHTDECTVCCNELAKHGAHATEG